MICKFCGRELDETMTFCPTCGKSAAEAAEATEETEAAVGEYKELVEEPAEEATEELTEATEELTEEITEEAEEITEEAEEVTEEAEEITEEAEEITEEAEEIAEEAEEITEEAPKAAKKKFPVVAVILCGLAACAVVALILFGAKLLTFAKSMFKGPRGEAALYSAELLITRDAYSVQDIESPEDSRMNTVSAYCGDMELTNADLQVFYFDAYAQFMNQYGYYASYIGLDTTVPLCEQASMNEGYTWEHSFMSDAMTSANAICAARQYCLDNGIALSEALQSEIDAMPQNLEDAALQAGYADALSYIQDSFGKGIDMDDFMRYYEGICYEQAIYDGLTCTDEEIEAYYENNPDVMTSNSISKVTVDVRHLLVKPEDADEDGVSTDEEWAAAEAEAQRLYQLYQENPTEDYFAELAGENTDDPGSQETGGLYEGVLPGQMVTEFNDWCFADGRAYGDTDIVKTDYGYHLMFFVAETESDTWKDDCANLCKSNKMTTFLQELMEKYPLYVWVDDIVLDELQKPAAATDDTTVTTEAVG